MRDTTLVGWKLGQCTKQSRSVFGPFGVRTEDELSELPVKTVSAPPKRRRMLHPPRSAVARGRLDLDHILRV